MLKPNWLQTFTNDSVSYGFDNIGLWFIGDSNEDQNYPVRTKFSIPQNDPTTVIFSFIHSYDCSDHSVCFFTEDVIPLFNWNENEDTRIAGQFNCNAIEISGQDIVNYGGEDFFINGLTYTAEFIYDPTALEDTGLFTLNVYLGNTPTGDPVASSTLEGKLPSGNYKIAFTADSDGAFGHGPQKSYFTYIQINNYFTTSGYCTPTSCTESGRPCFNQESGCNCKNMRPIAPIGSLETAYVPAITVCNQNL